MPSLDLCYVHWNINVYSMHGNGQMVSSGSVDMLLLQLLMLGMVIGANIHVNNNFHV